MGQTEGLRPRGAVESSLTRVARRMARQGNAGGITPSASPKPPRVASQILRALVDEEGRKSALPEAPLPTPRHSSGMTRWSMRDVTTCAHASGSLSPEPDAALDCPRMIARYPRPEMARIWSDDSRCGAWPRVEIAATEVLCQRGIVPAEALQAIKERADRARGPAGMIAFGVLRRREHRPRGALAARSDRSRRHRPHPADARRAGALGT